MTFDQNKYIKEYNKDNYKMYQFRVRKSNTDLIDFLDSKKERNSFIVETLDGARLTNGIYTIKQLKEIIKPILFRHNINEIYLFGSYARGEATTLSDVDIYCDKGDIRTMFDLGDLIDELEIALGKEVDIIFTTSLMDEYFKQHLMEDLIKLC